MTRLSNTQYSGGWLGKAKSKYSALLLLSFILTFSTTLACSGDVCLNGGTCTAQACQCSDNFFGVVCQNHASSYKIWFPDPKINKDKLLVYLKSLHIAKIEMNDLTNTATIIFKLKSVTRDQVVQVLSSRQINIAPQAITDVNECKANSIACHGNKICQNTDGSFKCACANGYKEEETGCVSTSMWKDATTLVWMSIIGSILFVLMCAIGVVYCKRHFRRKRLKKKYAERQKNTENKKKNSRSNATSTSSSNYLNDGKRTPSSTFYVNPHGNRYTDKTDGNDIYYTRPNRNRNNLRHGQTSTAALPSKYGARHFGRIKKKYNTRRQYDTPSYDLSSTTGLALGDTLSDRYDYLRQYSGPFDSQYVGINPYAGVLNYAFDDPLNDQYIGQISNHYVGPLDNQYDGTLSNQYGGLLDGQYGGPLDGQYNGPLDNQYGGPLEDLQVGTLKNPYGETIDNIYDEELDYQLPHFSHCVKSTDNPDDGRQPTAEIYTIHA